MVRLDVKAAAASFGQALFRPVDAAWLAAFRVLFGSVMAFSMMRFLAYGWVDRLFVEPQFHFKYWGFAWVPVLPGPLVHALFWVLAWLALAVALGVLFRFTATLLALGLTYFQLIDVSTYLNHYYLAALLAWLLSWSPAGRFWSIDARWRRRDPRELGSGAPFRAHVSALWLYLFRFQVGLVYTFAGLAKAQSDWLIHAQPLRIWLGGKTDLPIVGPALTLDWLPLLMSWGGFVFDTTIVWWLLFKRTRPWAFAAVVAFHVATRVLFPIGMFPAIMVLSALVFFEPSWPRALARRVRAGLARVGYSLWGSSESPERPEPARRRVITSWQRCGAMLVGVYCVLQLVLPLRFLGYVGNVLWHEQGMRFSWRVMVRAKGGNCTFHVTDTRSGHTWHVSPHVYLTGLQEMEMSGQPDLILQLAHHIRRDFEERVQGPVEVRVESRATLNGRRSVPLIDPSIDLALVDDGLSKASWVMPAPTLPPPHTRPVL